MIRAIGIDIVDVRRIEQAMRRPGFLERILTQREQAYCNTPQRVAGRWAAKEAAMKCLPSSAAFRQIEVLVGERGEPVLSLEPGLSPPGGRWLVTISHERGYAAAVVILETVEP
ncbi:MAG TPA: holo-ACP synthase [Fimbriimonadaceae bacterium]|nr:holo-ACP synthase [Fimbriimonadaceae bacterium]HRJ95123.1 holo-ACP synthase [Fimbriimonadaceae bacterium]